MRKTICLLALALLLPGCGAQVRTQPGLVDGFYTVRRVIDGDTIVLENVGPLRFLNYDAPEPGTPEGDALTARLKEMIEGKVVWVKFARKKNRQPRRGHYNRHLGNVYSSPTAPSPIEPTP